MDLYEMFKVSDQFDYVVVEATVATGMESSAMAEVKEKIPWVLDVCKSRGRVFFCTNSSGLQQSMSLRSVDRLYVIVTVGKEIVFTNSKVEALNTLESLLHSAKWLKAVTLWKSVSGFKGKCFPSSEEYSEAYLEEIALKNKVKDLAAESIPDQVNEQDDIRRSSLPQKVKEYKEKRNALKQSIATKTERQTVYKSTDERREEDKVLKFRMTCYRSGNHSFTSPDVACHLGGKLQEKFNWVVSLVHHDLEAVMNIRENEVYLAISLTKESLHKRNIVHFGPTTLRATVCYNLLRMASPCTGDIVMDPLCGGASIPVESCLSYQGLFNIAGDKHELAVTRSFNNIEVMPEKKKGYIDLLHWDVTNLPLRDSSIDVLVTDLPFGKRSGSKMNNQVLYRKAMLEAARCVSPRGRAVCLTWDRANLTRTIRVYNLLWTMARVVNINLGGLQATVYVLKRTGESFGNYLLAAAARASKKKCKKQTKN